MMKMNKVDGDATKSVQFRREKNVINGEECKLYDGNLIVARLDVIKAILLISMFNFLSTIISNLVRDEMFFFVLVGKFIVNWM